MRIAAIMMQKNEGDLLHFWIESNKIVFGYANLFILDNGSSDPGTLEILHQARLLGCRVIHHDDAAAYERREEIVTELIAKEASSYDWFFPLDCDEIVAAILPDGSVSLDSSAVLAELARAVRDGRDLVRVVQGFANIPYSSMGYDPHAFSDPKHGIRKTVVRSGFPDKLDPGYHFFDWARNKDTYDDKRMGVYAIAYFHFHNKPYISLLRSAREKLKGRVRDFSKDTLKNYKGKGVHLVRYFLSSETEYLSSFPKPSIDLTIPFMNVGLPIPFSGPASVTSESEVAAALDPLNLHRIYLMSQTTQAVTDELHRDLVSAQSFFEYGAGSSTVLACEMGVKRVVSIETALYHCDTLLTTRGLRLHSDVGRLRLKHVYIGDTGDWGFPTRPPQAEQLREYLRQPQLAWPFDIALVDGRYRVASAAAIYLAWESSQTTALSELRIHFRGFFERCEYSSAGDLFEVIAKVDGTAILRPVPGRADRASDLIEEFLTEPL